MSQAPNTKNSKKEKKAKKATQSLTPEEIQLRKQQAFEREQNKAILPYLNRIKIAIADEMSFCVQITKTSIPLSTLHTYLCKIVAKVNQPVDDDKKVNEPVDDDKKVNEPDDDDNKVNYTGAKDMILCLISPVEPDYDKKSDTSVDPEKKRIAISIYFPESKKIEKTETTDEFNVNTICSALSSTNTENSLKEGTTIVSTDWQTAIPFKDVDLVNATFIDQMKKNGCYPEEKDDDDDMVSYGDAFDGLF